ncbi:MAG: peptidoglycan DD-metalloendopeptidase family protein [Pegethrix bostrychoides GSE-TBD4-15B]|uniref:Peptidoglycan DD-metalloendopeptidase family protein n=1 Tax=Pegethrix bostrychoides GSE-TBD4-15B TaxID=2839662 RepID=A0A951PC85_9CYAN|nr:peptidoglycan DD-metalloendopeptidase family protein [Pegethrix bostrychoides GSE-TBD4-15B]
MKRAFLKEVKPVSSVLCSLNQSADVEAEAAEQTQSGARRRLRTSAAMVGLAISMGATGLLMPRHGDGASAAESNETAASSSQPASQVATLTSDLQGLITAPPPAAKAAGRPSLTSADYVVGQGQTLQQIAQRYQISVAELAAANRISTTAVVRPGQVLRVPGAVPVAQSSQMLALSELSRLPAPDSTGQVQARDQALSRLMQEQSKLKERLSELRRQDQQSERVALADSAALAPAVMNKQAPAASPAASVLALTPTVPSATVPSVTPTPELDWMQANRSLNIPSGFSSSPVSLPSHPETGESASRPSVTLPNSSSPSPAVTAMGLSAASEQAYQVSLGDTVARIARAHNVSPSELISANRLSNPDVIFVGQTLRLPAASLSSNGTVSTVLPAVPAQMRQDQLQAASPTRLAVVPSTLPSTGSEALMPAAPTVDEPSGRNPYVQNLLSEVRALRERRSQQARVQPNRELSASEQVAPETVAASPSASRTAAVLSRARLESPTVPTVPMVPTVQAQKEPAVVAVAPLNPESYAPLTEQIPGRMVSPDLPALPGADRFLPDGTQTGYIWPAKGLLTSGYGWRWGRMHSGIDIAADVGTPIYAAASGVVEYSGWNSGGYGNMVEIRHTDGSMTRYAHMNALYVQKGQRIGQSEQIGEMGSTGYSTGPHLHFEVHPVASGAVNPMAYLPAN